MNYEEQDEPDPYHNSYYFQMYALVLGWFEALSPSIGTDEVTEDMTLDEAWFYFGLDSLHAYDYIGFIEDDLDIEISIVEFSERFNMTLFEFCHYLMSRIHYAPLTMF